MKHNCYPIDLPVCSYDTGNALNNAPDCQDDTHCEGKEAPAAGKNFAWSTAAGFTKCGRFQDTKMQKILAKKCVHPDMCGKPCQGRGDQYWVTCGTVYDWISPEEGTGIVFGTLGALLYCMWLVCMCVVLKRTK